MSLVTRRTRWLLFACLLLLCTVFISVTTISWIYEILTLNLVLDHSSRPELISASHNFLLQMAVRIKLKIWGCSVYAFCRFLHYHHNSMHISNDLVLPKVLSTSTKCTFSFKHSWPPHQLPCSFPWASFSILLVNIFILWTH